jgi:hypothetical protein
MLQANYNVQYLCLAFQESVLDRFGVTHHRLRKSELLIRNDSNKITG